MERRGTPLAGLALAVAVFLSGAVLLGVEIAASRVLAPTFGSSLYVWGALIGVVLSGLAVGYALGGAVADRWPSPYLLVGAIALGAVLVLAIPLVDEWVLERVVSWDPGPRLDPLIAAIALFGPMSVVLASVSPIAVRLAARSLDRLGRTAGRLFSLSTAGSIAGTFATAFWLVPEYGTDQVLAVGAVVLLAAAAGVALVERVWVPAAVLVAGAAAAALAVGALAPDTTGQRLEGLAAKNWSPLYRERDARTPRKLDPAEVAEAVGTGFAVREARDTQYHRLVVVDGEGSRYLRFDSSFQSGMYIRQPFRTRFAYTDYLELGLAYNPNAKRILVIGLGGRLRAEARLARLRRCTGDRGRARSRRRRDRVPLVRAAARPPHRHRGRRRPPVPAASRRPLRRDHARRVLRGRRPVPHDHPRVRRASPRPAHAGRGRRGERHRRAQRQRVTHHARALEDVRLRVPDGPLPPGLRGRLRSDATDLRNIILVATERAAPSREQLAATWADVRKTRAPGAPTLAAAIRDRWERPVPVDDVPLLTDGYAPTDALLLD